MNKDILNIISYLFFLIVLALAVDIMFADVREYGYVNADTIDSLDPGIKEIWYGILAFSFGLFLGTDIIVIRFNKKKRLQGLLILISSLFIGLAFIHVVIPRIPAFVFGSLVSIPLCHKNDKDKNTKGNKQNKGSKQHARATNVVTFLPIYFMLLTLANLFLSIILSGTSKVYEMIGYSILVIVIGIVFYQFINYSISESKVFVIGPKRAGKTVFMCGCYQWTEDNEKDLGPPSPHIDRSLAYIYKGMWPEATGTTYTECNFMYEHGILFVKDIDVSTFDFGGESLEDDIDEIVSYIDRKNSDNSVKPLSITDKIGEGIYNAGKLIFLIEANSIKIDDAETGTTTDPILKYYKRILEKISDKPYYVVITKSDIYYKKEWPLTEECYYKFKKKIIKLLKKRQPFFTQLKRRSEDIIPIGLWLPPPPKDLGGKSSEWSDDEELEEDGDKKFIMIGFDKVLEAIAK